MCLRAQFGNKVFEVQQTIDSNIDSDIESTLFPTVWPWQFTETFLSFDFITFKSTDNNNIQSLCGNEIRWKQAFTYSPKHSLFGTEESYSFW